MINGIEISRIISPPARSSRNLPAAVGTSNRKKMIIQSKGEALFIVSKNRFYMHLTLI
tara:strand:+ start:177 stop:350 length:174 start_codon:yes stop_codon:yes gene_type:complete